MKGTLEEITSQESGIIIYDPWRPRTREDAYLDNWSSNFTEYTCDRRRTRVIANCLAYLEDRIGRDYDGRLRYTDNADPVVEDDLRRRGVLYRCDGFDVLAPDRWA
jgi:hypothetical protein